MRSTNVLFAVALAIVHVSGTQEGRSCGLRIAPCPDDMYCQPNEPSCTDEWRCPGQCAYKNTYSSCGGFRVKPVSCAAGYRCQDDPRDPDSCGMACDKPGICVPEGTPACHDKVCPEGLYYYEASKIDMVDGPGICL